MIFDTGFNLNDLPENSLKKIIIEKEEIVIGKKNDRLYAFNNTCPHRAASLYKGSFHDDNIVCYMHGYEYNIYTGKLENMKSWKKDKTWIEQTDQWRYSDDLKIYKIYEKDGRILIEIN